jgi:uncharacterized repeat protein (TIGR01451 family)
MSSGYFFLSAAYSGSAVHEISTEVIAMTVDLPANLFVQKTSSPDPVHMGSPLTFTITVTNFGPGTGTAVMLTDVMPTGMSYNSSTSSQGSCSFGAGAVSCALGDIANGVVATVTIGVTPSIYGSIVNSATVTSYEDHSPDNNTSLRRVLVTHPCTRSDSTVVYVPWDVAVDDGDCDGFRNVQESFFGTNPSAGCGVLAWPPDQNDDGVVELADVLRYNTAFGGVSPNPPYQARFDLNSDGRIALEDILALNPYFGLNCVP